MTEKNKERHYCEKCLFRADNLGLHYSDFCDLGYTQNPNSFEATKNSVENSGPFTVCPYNPWRKAVFRKLGIIVPENTYETYIRKG